MSELNNAESIMDEVVEAADMAITELTDGDLDNCSGGCSGFGDIESLFKGSSSFFSQSGVSMDQVSFAGPNGAGSMSSLDAFSTESGNTTFTGFGL
ncbi:MAG: CTB family bacteriocin [Nodosilinea sp.]